MKEFINKHPFLFTFFVLPAVVAIPIVIFGNPANVNPPPPPPPRKPTSLDDFFPDAVQLSGIPGYDGYGVGTDETD